MKVIDPNIATSIIKTLPRSFDETVTTSIKVTEDGTKVSQVVEPTDAYIEGNYTVFECVLSDLREDYMYFLEITQSSDTKVFNKNTGEWDVKDVPSPDISTTLLYRDKIYVTAYELSEHSLNNGEYVINEDNDNSEYITYDN